MSDEFLARRLPDRLPDNPMLWLEAWLAEATRRGDQPNPNSMTMVSLSEAGLPSARIVLCKGLIADPGFIVFYTNYDSRKGHEIIANPDVAVVFHWDTLGRQVRLEGLGLKSPQEESDSYFPTRGVGSRLGAWGSDQSQPIASREALKAQLRSRAEGLGIPLDEHGQPTADADVPRPPHWGGFRIWPRRMELWVDGSDRIHDRAVFERPLERDGDSMTAGPWSGQRLQP